MRPWRFLFCVAPAVAVACAEISDTDYSSFADIPAEGMPQGWEFVFNPTQSDSAAILSGHHDVVVVARYTNECHSRSISLDIEEISFSNPTPATTRVEIDLFGDDGRPLGTGVYGVYEIADTIHRQIEIADGYSIAVSSPLQFTQTRGMKAIGIVIPRSGSRPVIPIPEFKGAPGRR